MCGMRHLWCKRAVLVLIAQIVVDLSPRAPTPLFVIADGTDEDYYEYVYNFYYLIGDYDRDFGDYDRDFHYDYSDSSHYGKFWAEAI